MEVPVTSKTTEKTKAHRVVVLKLAERDGAALVGDGGARVAIDDRLDVGARGKGDRAGVAAEHLADLEIRAVELRIVALERRQRDSTALVRNGLARVPVDDGFGVGAVGIARNRALVAAKVLADAEIRTVQARIIRLERRQGDSAALVRNGLARVSRNNLFGVGAVRSGKQHASARDAGRKEKGGERGRQEGCHASDHGGPAEALKTTAENWKGGEAMGKTGPWWRTARVS